MYAQTNSKAPVVNLVSSDFLTVCWSKIIITVCICNAVWSMLRSRFLMFIMFPLYGTHFPGCLFVCLFFVGFFCLFSLEFFF